MSNPYFRFKQFTVWHDRCAMKVGTDGTLLGAWAGVDKAHRILDVGTGTGLIALMLAQRNPEAHIDGIDIDADACLQALENVRQSPFSKRIHIINTDFDTFTQKTAKTYDLIVSNPPFFKDSLKCPAEKRRLARHNDNLPLYGLLVKGESLLHRDGRLSLILPYAHHDELMRTARQIGFHITRQTRIIPVKGATPKRLLVEFANAHTSVLKTDELILEDRTHQRTRAYQQLTQDFYL